jgi:uncharacterized protein YdaU (DUF1376 family)
MPLYIGDYLADTMHLSHPQHGIYFLLIMAYWRNGGPLPDDPGQLAAIAKCSGPEWRKHVPVISRFFHIDAGSWSHKRIDTELAGAITKTQERSKAGAEGARQRWQTDSKAMAEPLANASQNDAPSPSPLKKEEMPNGILSENGSGRLPDASVEMTKIWNEECGSISRANKPNASRRGRCARAWRHEFGGSADQWRAYCRRVAASPHLRGENDREWRADLDWVLKPENISKIQEGRYERRSPVSATCAGPDQPAPSPEELFGHEYAGKVGMAH